jgi:hypothetical protein
MQQRVFHYLDSNKREQKMVYINNVEKFYTYLIYKTLKIINKMLKNKRW